MGICEVAVRLVEAGQALNWQRPPGDVEIDLASRGRRAGGGRRPWRPTIGDQAQAKLRTTRWKGRREVPPIGEEVDGLG